MGTLTWRTPDGRTGRAELPPAGGIIGRSASSELRVDHRSISRRHARLDLGVDGVWRIADLGSRNGVIVGSRRVAQAPVEAGVPIQLGDVVLEIEEAPRPSEAPVPEETQETPPPAGRVAPLVLEGDPLLEEEPLSDDPPDLDALADPDVAPEDAAEPAGAPAADVRASFIEELLSDDLDDPRSADGSIPRTAPLPPLATDPPASPADRGSVAPAAPDDPADPPTDAATDEGARPPRVALFRSSERWILVAVGLLLITAVLVLELNPRGEAPTPDPAAGDRRGGVAEASPDADRPDPSTPATEDAPPQVVPVPVLPLVERIAALPGRTVESAWSATAFLLGRAPTPEEVLEFGSEGPDALLVHARALPEHWRHRARTALARESLPDVLLPDEVPLRTGEWSAIVRREHDARSETSTEESASFTPPLPAPNGGDDAYADAYRAALTTRRPSLTWSGALRSVWTAGAGRPLDPEVEGWIAEIVASDLPPDELLHRFLLLVAGAHPFLCDPATAPDEERLLATLPPLDRGAAWPRGGLATGIAPELWWASAVERTLPHFEDPPPPVGPSGRLRIEVHCPFPVRPLLSEPGRIPRLWRRLADAELHICRRSDGPSALLHARAGTPGSGEISIVAGNGPASNAGSETEEGARRVADGYLLPAFGAIAGRLGVTPALEAPDESATAWLERARVGRSDSGERMFRAGGFRLVPGEWRASAYRAPTRALLLAGAQLLERPGGNAVAVLHLEEPPSSGPDGEWSEWMTALELVAGRLEDHPFTVWLWGTAPGGSAEAVFLRWGPEVRRGWVVEEDVPGEALHPRLAESYVAPSAGGEPR